MTKYRIINAAAGVDMGIYEGETEQDAYLAMAKDAGYETIEEMEDVAPVADGEIRFEVVE